MGFSQNGFEYRKNSHATFLEGMSPTTAKQMPLKVLFCL